MIRVSDDGKTDGVSGDEWYCFNSTIAMLLRRYGQSELPALVHDFDHNAKEAKYAGQDKPVV